MRFKVMLTLFCLLAPAAQAETLKVAIPQKGNWDTSITIYGQRAGIFKKLGLDLDFIYTEGGATTMQTVLSGSVDVGVQSGLLGLLGAYAKGAPARVIGAGATGASDLYWYSKAGSGIKTLADAKGKTIAYSNVGSSSNLVLLSLLKDAKVDAKTVHTGGQPGTFTQVMSGQIAVGWAAAPFGLDQIKAGTIQVVARGSDAKAMADETIRVTFTSAGVLAKKRAALEKYMEGYVQSVDWVYTHQQAVEWFAKDRGIPLDIAQEARDKYYLKADEQPFEIKGLDLALKQAYQYKFIPHPMKPSDFKGLFDILAKKPS